MTDHWAEISTWFARVCDLPREEGVALLERECDDPAVRTEVLELLRAGEDASATLTPSDAFRDALGGGLDHEERDVGPYRLEALVGQGGMGSVWRAVRSDGRFEQTVAVKIVKRGLDTDEVVRRFRRERQLLADLDHPHIARLLDGGRTDDGRPYLVMEYVDGAPIDAWCRARDPSVADRVKLVIAVARAVQVAHDRGVVHRDLKPSNVLVKDDGSPKLLDFGIAKLLEDDGPEASLVTQTGQRVLTPRYAAPEQVRGEEISPATDVYALGVLLYELLTGRSPHDLNGTSAMELERAICLDDATRPSLAAPRELKTSLKGDLDLVILRALSKEPTRRYRTAADLADDLRRHLEGRPILARPDTLTYRVGKFVRRNRLLVAATLAVIVALTAGLVVALDQYAEAEAARGVAEEARASADEQRDEARVRSFTASLAAADGMARSHRRDLAALLLAEAPEELRGWEWDYLSASLDRSLWHTPIAATAIAFSPDERRVAVGGAGRATLLDGRSGEALGELPHGDGRVLALAFGPDGTRLATGDSKGRLRVFAVDAEQVRFESSAHPRGVTAVAWSRDGSLVADGSADGRLLVRSAETGEVLRRLDAPRLRSLAFHPSGDRLAGGGEEGELRVWDLATDSDEPSLSALTHPSPVRNLTWIVGGTRLRFAADIWKTVVTIDAATGAVVSELERPEDAWKAMAVSADGSVAAFVNAEERRVDVVDVETGEVVGELVGGRAHGRFVTDVALAASGARLVTGSKYGVRLWDAAGSPNEWTMETQDSGTRSIALTPDGAGAAVSVSHGDIHLFDVASGLHIGTLEGHRKRCHHVTFDPTGRLLASASEDCTFRLWDVETRTQLHQWNFGRQLARAVAFDRDGRRLFSAGSKARIEVRDVETMKLLDTWLDHEAGVFDLALSPDGRRLASGGGRWSPSDPGDARVRIWDVATGQVVHRLDGHESVVTTVAWSPDGRRVSATGWGDARLRTWDAETGAPLGAPSLRGAHSRVDGIAWLDDDRLLAAAGDNTVRLFGWSPRSEMFALRGLRGGSFALAPDPALRFVVATGAWEARVFDRRPARETVSGTVVRRLARRLVRPARIRAAVEADRWLTDDQRRAALVIVERLQENPVRWTRHALRIVDQYPDQLPEALRYARAAREVDPNLGWAAFAEAAALYRLGRFDEAWTVHEETTPAAPDWREGRLDLVALRALLLAGRGDEAAGRVLFEETVRAHDARAEAEPAPRLTLLFREAERRWGGRAIEPAEEDAP